MNSSPPKWMVNFFRWYCRKDLVDAIEGDLLEVYKRQLNKRNKSEANAIFFWQTLRFFQPFTFRRQHEQYQQLNTLHMFYNYLKIGIRFMSKHKSYTAINVSGLAVGLSAFFLMAMFVVDELSYDKFHEKGNDIIRLGYQLETPNATRLGAKLPFPMKVALEENFPEVEKVVRFLYSSFDTPLLEYNAKRYTEDKIYFSEPSMFDVFDFKLLRGNPETALSDPRSIILTESMVAKYFGNEDPMGKIMKYKNQDDLMVTGIMEDVPDNSHISFEFLLPIELQRQRWMGWGQSTYDLELDWNWAGAWVYAEMKPGIDLDRFTEKIQVIADEHLNTKDQSGFSLLSQPLLDIHLKSDMSGEASVNGNVTQVYSFAIIGLLILFIACVNFINLSTAQSNKRTKEVGMRKVMGAQKKQLIYQFLSESFIVVLISSLIALLITMATLPYFNVFTDKDLTFQPLQLPFLGSLLVLVLLIAIIAGLRPAIASIKSNIIEKLSGGVVSIEKKNRLSKILVIGQFVISNFLIIGIIVVNSQLNFLQNKDLGFAKDHMLIPSHGRNLTNDQFDLLNNELNSNPSILATNRGYIAGTRSYTNTFKKAEDQNSSSYSMGIKWVGEDFTSMFELKVISGRDFDPSSQADRKNAILINESGVKALGWTPESIIGKELSLMPGGAKTPDIIRVIGVIADANFESLYDPVLPSVFRMVNGGGDISIKLTEQSAASLSATLMEIQTAWDKVVPDWPFEFTFLDQQIDDQYVKEARLASAIQYFTLLAIFIACLGLYGLASFMVQQRTKEIGIRKVLGASSRSILSLISRNFLILVGASFVLSIPVSYYVFNGWLQDFAFRISIGPLVFITSAVLSIVIAVIAVGWQSLRAANLNPVRTLRYE